MGRMYWKASIKEELEVKIKYYGDVVCLEVGRGEEEGITVDMTHKQLTQLAEAIRAAEALHPLGLASSISLTSVGIGMFCVAEEASVDTG